MDLMKLSVATVGISEAERLDHIRWLRMDVRNYRVETFAAEMAAEVSYQGENPDMWEFERGGEVSATRSNLWWAETKLLAYSDPAAYEAWLDEYMAEPVIEIDD